MGQKLKIQPSLLLILLSLVQADAAADEANPEGLELAGMEGSNGTMPQSSLQSHSLGGDAYSEDEFEEAYHAVRPVLLSPSAALPSTYAPLLAPARCNVWCDATASRCHPL